jgi:hypothetical protein
MPGWLCLPASAHNPGPPAGPCCLPSCLPAFTGPGRQPGSPALTYLLRLTAYLPLQGLVANLGHQHSRVRVSVLEALDALVAHGALPAGR